MRKKMEENVDGILEKITALLPKTINEEIAREAGVSTGWVSEVRNGKKKSAPTQKAIANVAIKKGIELMELGRKLTSALS